MSHPLVGMGTVRGKTSDKSTPGSFAPGRHDEADASLNGQTGSTSPPRWDDVSGRFEDAVADFLFDYDGGTAEVPVLDLVGMTEDEAASAFGPGRASWLAGLSLRADAEFYQTAPDSWDGPAEHGTDGRAEIVETSTGTVVESRDWGEDPPEFHPITRSCPVDESGQTLADLSDPRWGQVGGAYPAHYWVDNGFHSPTWAQAWADTGLHPADAVWWDEAGYLPHEVSQHLANGRTTHRQARGHRLPQLFESPSVDREARMFLVDNGYQTASQWAAAEGLRLNSEDLDDPDSAAALQRLSVAASTTKESK